MFFPSPFLPCANAREDIPLLVRHFVRQFAQRMNKTIDAISPETMESLTQYLWPGNIRELQNVIERSVVMHEKGKLTVKKSWLCSEWCTGAPARTTFGNCIDGRPGDHWRGSGRDEGQSVRAVGRGSQARYSAIDSGIEDQVDEHQQVSVQDGVKQNSSPIHFPHFRILANSRRNRNSVVRLHECFQEFMSGPLIAR